MFILSIESLSEIDKRTQKRNEKQTLTKINEKESKKTQQKRTTAFLAFCHIIFNKNIWEREEIFTNEKTRRNRIKQR